MVAALLVVVVLCVDLTVGCLLLLLLLLMQHYREAGMFEVTDDKTGETLHCAATRFYGMET